MSPCKTDKRICLRLSLICAALFLSLTAARGEEMVRFDSFRDNRVGWNTRTYWGGTVGWENKELILRSAPFDGGFRGKICGSPLKPRIDLAGRRFRITVGACGKGELRAGFLITSSADGKTSVENACPEQFSPMSEQLVKYTFTVDLWGKAPSALAPFVEIRGENAEARLKYVRIDAVQDKDVVMTLLTPLSVVPENSPAPERRFRCSLPNTEICLYRFDQPLTPPDIRIVKSDDQGVVTAGTPHVVNGLVKFTAAIRGAAANGFIVSLPPNEYQRMTDLAGQVPKVKKETHILYIGDSLNDFDRGFNSVDRLEYFLNLYQPERFVFHNYSVAGDYITRVEERLRSRSERYQGIFDRPYDLILIALGTNDCRSMSTSGYASPLVTPEEGRASYERVIAMLREHSPVPIWLLSPSYSNYDFQIRQSEAAVQAGRLGVRFGIPKHLAQYSTMLKNLADSKAFLRYIDICTPMKDAFSPENYNPADGVHLSLRGHRLFSEILLRAFVLSHDKTSSGTGDPAHR